MGIGVAAAAAFSAATASAAAASAAAAFASAAAAPASVAAGTGAGEAFVLSHCPCTWHMYSKLFGSSCAGCAGPDGAAAAGAGTGTAVAGTGAVGIGLVAAPVSTAFLSHCPWIWHRYSGLLGSSVVDDGAIGSDGLVLFPGVHAGWPHWPWTSQRYAFCLSSSASSAASSSERCIALPAFSWSLGSHSSMSRIGG